MQVLVRDNNVDQALKALKKKMQREGVFREMKLRRNYEKPSEKRAREQAEAVRRARKLLADSRLSAMTLTALVKGLRIAAPGEPGDGQLWTPGQRVRVISEPHGLDGIYFLMARNFSGSRGAGAVTQLTLTEDSVWVLDAHPHKNQHRRGVNAIMQDAPA